MKGYVINVKPGAMDDNFHFLMNSSLYDALWFAYCLEVGILHEIIACNPPVSHITADAHSPMK